MLVKKYFQFNFGYGYLFRNFFVKKINLKIEFGIACVRTWYNEVVDYDFNNPGYSPSTGHFSQVIWKNSIYLGIGIGVGKHNDLNAFYCVGQYEPPGNVNTAANFRSNVLPIA